MYLSFFPVVVGMVKGLRSPDAMQLDQMKTWNASRSETFWKLRLPSSAPYLFASLKVGVAASLIGGPWWPSSAFPRMAGLARGFWQAAITARPCRSGARSCAAATLAAVLVWSIGAVQNVTLRRMGFSR